jgi:hypothetical protein
MIEEKTLALTTNRNPRDLLASNPTQLRMKAVRKTGVYQRSEYIFRRRTPVIRPEVI